MIIYDFFAGTGSSTRAFEDAGHTVISFELDPKHKATETANVLDLVSDELLAKYGRPDFVWASPPCTAFSIAGIRFHWLSGGDNPVPKSQMAVDNQELVKYTVKLIEELNPRYGFLIENPRGMLRKLPHLKHLPHTTITYCQYGDTRMKPTDLWGWVNGWIPRPMCSPSAPCHEPAPRGSSGGVQGQKDAATRSMIPYELGQEIMETIEASYEYRSTK